MVIQESCPCKINLLLNILGRRPDGYHELETLLQPVDCCDQLILEPGITGIQLTCSDPALPIDSGNLVYRAAQLFLSQIPRAGGVRIHLEKQVPLAAGLGGGSSDAAHTLVGMNALFGGALAPAEIQRLAEQLGSDVPFFLQRGPALGLGRGERIVPLEPFPALRGVYVLLIHPGFGVSTAWAYQQLVHYPAALHGQAGRAQRLADQLRQVGPAVSLSGLYNSLEAPVLVKYPILALIQDVLRSEGALAVLMSGSGSTTFGLVASRTDAERLMEKLREQFGRTLWTRAVAL